jgi:hypothetical protein
MEICAEFPLILPEVVSMTHQHLRQAVLVAELSESEVLESSHFLYGWLAAELSLGSCVYLLEYALLYAFFPQVPAGF